MLCAYTRPRYQVSVYRTIGPLVCMSHDIRKLAFCICKNKVADQLSRISTDQLSRISTVDQRLCFLQHSTNISAS